MPLKYLYCKIMEAETEFITLILDEQQLDLIKKLGAYCHLENDIIQRYKVNSSELATLLCN